jgi:hypothetical protein
VEHIEIAPKHQRKPGQQPEENKYRKQNQFPTASEKIPEMYHSGSDNTVITT